MNEWMKKKKSEANLMVPWRNEKSSDKHRRRGGRAREQEKRNVISFIALCFSPLPGLSFWIWFLIFSKVNIVAKDLKTLIPHYTIWIRFYFAYENLCELAFREQFLMLFLFSFNFVEKIVEAELVSKRHSRTFLRFQAKICLKNKLL